MFLQIHMFSENIGRQTHVNVILPQPQTNGLIGMNANQGEIKKYRTLYLLHGLSDDNTVWHSRTSIERYVAGTDIAVIMPDAGRSWYTDEKFGYKYYQYIAKELPVIMESVFPLSKDPKDRYIGGLSMGGYGALKIGLREQGTFSKIIALSAVSDLSARLNAEKNQAQANNQPYNFSFTRVFGDDLVLNPEDDVRYLAQNYYATLRPDIFIAIGRDDWHLQFNNPFYQELQSYHFNVIYTEDEGNHNWEFWDKYIQIALKWIDNYEN